MSATRLELGLIGNGDNHNALYYRLAVFVPLLLFFPYSLSNCLSPSLLHQIQPFDLLLVLLLIYFACLLACFCHKAHGR